MSKNFSLLIVNESTKNFISFNFTSLNFFESDEVDKVKINSLKASMNALLITNSFLKFALNGSEISISLTLKIFENEIVGKNNSIQLSAGFCRVMLFATGF